MKANLAAMRAVLIDMDGVLYRGQTALAGAGELLAFLRDAGLKYLLVTNNSTLSQEQFAARLAGMGIAVAPESIMTSGVATAAYLRTLAPAGTTVNVVGEEALVNEMRKAGFTLAGRDAAYVVCGWDKTITYEKLKIACLAIRAGARFIGTNPDKTYPLEHDIIPGAGSIIAALVAATDTQPTIVGKPEPIIIEQALRWLGATAAETAILGDRLDTDVLAAYNSGALSILVLTGISTAAEAAAATVKPDLIYADLPALIAAWREVL
jgi:4-nitrophenyl phosphatase